jgi:peptidoglycan/LPS O-acetylase OafA/YrhL
VKASTLSFRSAVCLGIAGIAIGIIMAASKNHSVMPAHAHLNLLGWVSLFLIGIFYRLHPALDASRAALVQAVIWIAGTLILTCGVTAIYLGRTEFEPVAIAGSLTVLAAMLMFAYLVFRPEWSAARVVGAMSPAE